ncbi:MAG: helix-turn-helix transcriptional regulator [Bacteroidetes bacterium]|nr:MAG: helix-turn-helix transcriptional regulator [Bacteroidota bacterium]
MGSPMHDRKAVLLAAIAHPNRIRILEELRGTVKCNCELAPALGLEQSNLSRHLKVLTDAGVLVSWREGVRVNFKVADAQVYGIIDLAGTVARRTVPSPAMEEA